MYFNFYYGVENENYKKLKGDKRILGDIVYR